MLILKHRDLEGFHQSLDVLLSSLLFPVLWAFCIEAPFPLFWCKVLTTSLFSCITPLRASNQKSNCELQSDGREGEKRQHCNPGAVIQYGECAHCCTQQIVQDLPSSGSCWDHWATLGALGWTVWDLVEITSPEFRSMCTGSVSAPTVA